MDDQQPPVPSGSLDELRACIEQMFSVTGIEITRDTVKAFLVGKAVTNNWRNQARNSAQLAKENPKHFDALEMIVDIVVGVGDMGIEGL